VQRVLVDEAQPNPVQRIQRIGDFVGVTRTSAPRAALTASSGKTRRAAADIIPQVRPSNAESATLPTVVFATRNAGKLREARHRLEGASQVRGLDAFPPVVEPEEEGSTFAVNARTKALAYARTLAPHLEAGTYVLAEDAGLEVFALDGFPGVHSSRVAASDPERIALVLAKLKERRCVAPESRRARFVSAMALVRDGVVVAEVQGEVQGYIADEPRGNSGFGYDPVFYYELYGRTFGECALEEKQAVSHRGKSLDAIRRVLGGT
jgi:XTP/dITP diphosphohydrolase